MKVKDSAKSKKAKKKVAMASTNNKLSHTLMDSSVSTAQKVGLLQTLIKNDDAGGIQALVEIVDAATRAGTADSVAADKKKLDQLLEDLKNGPITPGMFVQFLNGRAFVKINGQGHLLFVSPHVKKESVTPGSTLLCSLQGGVVIDVTADLQRPGDIATFERKVSDYQIQARGFQDEILVFDVSETIAKAITDKKLESGSRLICDKNNRFAFDILPPEDGLSHFRYLSRMAVPDVLVERDIANPMPFLGEVLNHIDLEMTDASINRQYNIHRSIFKMLTGVAGSGKSLHINAIWRKMYEAMSKHTGIPIDQLPPRVLHLRSATVLSMWYGESEKQIDRFFDEVEQLAREPWTAPDGRKLKLPVMIIAEEIEALGRSRGGQDGGDGISDRVMTVLLQRLDKTNRTEMKDSLIVGLFTSNCSHLIDPAMMRRIGGTVERFYRLDKVGFTAVLSKHIAHLPVWNDKTETAEVADLSTQNQLAAKLTEWMFAEDAEWLAKINYHGGGKDMKRRSDLLTADLINRSIQQAARVAAQRTQRGEQPGIIAEDIRHSLDVQIKNIVAQLDAHNVGRYIDLPEGVHVVSVERAVS